MLIYEKYRGIKLTDKGISIAIVIRNRHGLLFEFFKLIGVTEQLLLTDTEGFKHHLHPESIYKVEKLVSIMRKSEFIMLEDIKRIEENN
jgi:DtxR family transcriptional regulator, manganese transport regulator